jgi:hypothetical protein
LIFFVARVIGVDLNRTKVTDADLKGLVALKGLRTLKLAICVQVTGAALKDLAALQMRA